jgi:eukaryotic-like serine/threonine-protein kinase
LNVQTLAGGRYRIDRPLGHGGMASVYLGQDEQLGRPVALKLLAENLSADQALRERFVREARLAARLSHPNVVQVFDSGEQDGRPYLVMEYVEGRSLAEAVREQGKLAPAEVADIAEQACAGLAHAHEHGLVHRDLKPGNLLRRDDGCVKIADFGIARAAESTRLTQVGTVLGTATYLSPEQAAGAEATPASDLYTLGVTLYELLTGSPPYRIESLADLPSVQRDGAIPPPGAPPELAGPVMWCLAVDPARRPGSAAELGQAIGGAPNQSATAPTTVLPRPGRWAPATRHISPRWWLAAAVLGVIVLVVVLATRGGGAKSPPTVAPVKHSTSPSGAARNLGNWIRANSR